MKNKNLSYFLCSNIISRFGDSIDLIAFMWLTYKVTNSALLTGIVAAFNGVPSIILGLFAGVIADKYNKKRLMLIGDMARALIVTIICILYVINSLNVVVLIVATLLISTFEIISTPARRAILPILVEKKDLLKANSKLSSGKLIAQLVGLSISGLIIAHFGIIVGVAIDALTFYISFLLISRMCIIIEKENHTLSANSIISEIKEGMSVLLHEKVVFKTTILATFVNLFIGCFNFLILNYCVHVLHNDSNGQSILTTVNVIGVLAVSFFFIKLTQKISEEKMIDLGFILLGISFILFSINHILVFAIIITFIYGVGTGFISVISVSLIQRDTPKKHLGKVLSIISLVNESSIPLGNLLAGILINKINISQIFLIYGGVMILVTFIINLFFKIFSSKFNQVVIESEE